VVGEVNESISNVVVDLDCDVESKMTDGCTAIKCGTDRAQPRMRSDRQTLIQSAAQYVVCTLFDILRPRTRELLS